MVKFLVMALVFVSVAGGTMIEGAQARGNPISSKPLVVSCRSETWTREKIERQMWVCPWGDGQLAIGEEEFANLKPWKKLISEVSQEEGMDPNVMKAIVMVESRGVKDRISDCGAVGLGGVMSRDAVGRCGFSAEAAAGRLSQEELLDPETNLKEIARILKEMINEYGSLEEALGWYFGGGNAYYAQIILQLADHIQTKGY